MNAPLSLKLENAIGTIRSFLAATVEQLPGVEAMNTLSGRIEDLHAIREGTSYGALEEAARGLTCSYRACLEQLQSRLSELEPRLVAERERCLRAQEHTLRARAWHDVTSQLY